MATQAPTIRVRGHSQEAARTWIPLLLVLSIQSILLSWNIGLLTLWTDEAFTLDTVVQPVARILHIVRGDIHPPLYFLLAHAWIQVPFGGDILERVRMFSAVWTLVATVAMDRLWLARLGSRQRYVALALWCFSPAVLLYGRMGRSYLMQTALVVVAVALTWRFLMQPGIKRMLLSACAITGLFYTHYAPALAIMFAFSAAMAIRAIRGRTRPGLWAVWASITAAAYLPWVLQFKDAFGRWIAASGFSSNYRLTGGAATEQALKIAYGLISFTIGENFPVWALAAVPAVLVVLSLSVPSIWRRHRELACILAGAALVGYLGVAHWVSYPFIPARLLWILPFFIMAIALGFGSVRRPAGLAVMVFLLIADAASVVSYHAREHFLNKAYAVPLPEIGHLVSARSSPADSLVLLDSYNTDSLVLLRYVSRDLPHLILTAKNEARARAMLRDPRVRHIWFVGNTHDISPGRITTRIRLMACEGSAKRQYDYLPYEAWERKAMQLMGIADPPSHFYQVTECFR